MTTSVPLTGSTVPAPFTIEDRRSQPGEVLQAETVNVSPDYFAVLGTPLRRGRLIEESDQRDKPLVVLIDQTTAQRFWPNESPLGKRLKLGPPQSRQPWAAIVGVVGDIRHDGVDVDGVPHLYFPIYQRSGRVLGLMLRSPADPHSLSDPVRRAIQAVDPNLPVFGERTLEEMVAASLAQRRFSAQLMAAFAVLAMLLGAVGIYGVLACSIGQRTREIGIRMALGARRSDVIRLILWQGMRLIVAGIAIGAACALGFSRLLSGLVYGVSVTDPLVFASVTVVLAASAFLASYLPAHRATRIDPLHALRCD
jgi:predicted permease